MPRQRRNFPSDQIFHVMNRAVARSEIFSQASDYIAFEKIMAEMQLRIPIRILAWCLMPNHWHLVLWPQQPDEVSKYMKLITGTHSQRWHLLRQSQGTGALYQSRFKACAIEDSDYLLTVLRYVERNPFRAKLVKNVRDWRWSSLALRIGTVRRTPSNRDNLRPQLTASPIPLPEPWLDFVEQPQTNKELEELQLVRLQKSIESGIPYGSDDWQKKTAKLLGLESLLAPRGRPKKQDR